MAANQLWAVNQHVGDHGQYKILGLIASGTYSEVYRCAVTNSDNIIHAVKRETAPGRLTTEHDCYALFGTTSVFAPNLITHNLRGTPKWMAMSLEGPSLADALATYDDKCMPPERVLSIGYHSVLALKELHGYGIIHRDVSADNLLFRRTEEKFPILLIGFGNARRVLRGGSRSYREEDEEAERFPDTTLPTWNMLNRIAPTEFDDLYALAFVLIQLRNAWDTEEKEAHDRDSHRQMIMYSLKDYLDEQDHFLLPPLTSIFTQSYSENTMPNYTAILDAFRGCEGFYEEGWKEEKNNSEEDMEEIRPEEENNSEEEQEEIQPEAENHPEQ